MAKTQVLNLQGEKVKDLTLKDAVWNVEVNTPVMKYCAHNPKFLITSSVISFPLDIIFIFVLIFFFCEIKSLIKIFI